MFCVASTKNKTVLSVQYLWPNKTVTINYKITKSTQPFKWQFSNCVSRRVSFYVMSFYVLEQVSDMNGAVRWARDTGAETPPPL